MRVSPSPHLPLRFLCTLALAATILPVTAGTHTWIGGATGFWSNPANWSGGVPTPNEAAPTGTVVAFNTSVSSTCDIVGLVVDKIVFNGTGNVIGGTTTLGIKGDIQQDQIQNGAGTNILAASLPLDFTGNSSIFVRVLSGDLTIGSSMSGSRQLRKLGPGNLTLTGFNTFTSPTTVADGPLFLNSDGNDLCIKGDLFIGTASGTGASVSLLQSLEISNSSNVTVHSDGTLNMVNRSDTIGSLTVNGGSVLTGTVSLATTGILTMNGGSISGAGNLSLLANVEITGSSGTSSTISSPILLNGSRNFTVTDGTATSDLVLSNAISNGSSTSSFTKLGGGNLLMSMASGVNNTYTGGTSVQAGTLTLNGSSSSVINGNLAIGTGTGTPGTAGTVRLGQPSEIVDTATVTVNGGGLLDLNTFFESFSTLNLSGEVTVGTGVNANLTLITTNIFPGGDLSLLGGKFTSNGLLTMSGGTVTGGGAASVILGGNVSATAPGTPPVITANISLNGTRTFTVAPGSAQPELTINGVISETLPSLGIVKAGDGTLKLHNNTNNGFTGQTNVARGRLQILADSNRTISGPLLIGNNIDPPGSAVLQELLSNDIDSAVPVTIGNSGTLEMGTFNDTIAGLSGSGDIILTGPNSVLTVNNDNSTTTFSGSVTGIGTFRKSGTGTLNFTGTMASTLARSAVLNGTVAYNFAAGTGHPLIFQVGDDGGAVGSAVASLMANNQLATTSTLDIRQDGRLDVNATTTSIGNASISKGSIALGGGQLTVNGLVMFDGLVSGTGTLGIAGPVTASAVSTGAGISSNIALIGSPSITVNSNAVQPELVLSGVIGDGPDGPGGFTKLGPGTLRYNGAGNTFTGTASIDRGLFQMNASATSTVLRRLVIGNDVDVADSAIARNLVNLNFSSITEVVIKGSGQLDLNNFNDRAGSLSGNGKVSLGSARLTVGQNGLSCTFDGLITGSGLAGITKAGSGTFTMTRDNTYPGITNADGGLLLVNGSQASTSVVVGATGAVGGTGIIGTPLTATAVGSRVAPGGAAPGILRVNGNANLAGARLAVRLNDAAVPKADQLLVSGNLDISGAKLGPIPSGPISATPYVIATYGAFGGTLTGTFGSIPPGCTVNYAYNDGSGSNHIAITVTNPWQAWLAGYGLDPASTGLPDFDFDKDGLPNAIEFVLGTDPTKQVLGAVQPEIASSGANFVFSFRRNGAAAYLNPAAEIRDTLGGVGPWTTIGSGIVVTPNFFSPGIDKVTVTIPKAGRRKAFGRLRVTVP